jgi:hypothetical protein
MDFDFFFADSNSPRRFQTSSQLRHSKKSAQCSPARSSLAIEFAALAAPATLVETGLGQKILQRADVS